MLSYYKPLLIGLFNKVQYLQNQPDNEAELCLDIQETLIQKIGYVEHKIRISKDIIKQLKAQLAARQYPPRTKADAKKLKDEVSYREYILNEYNRLLFILRSIGDAIAFTYISKWDIKPMAYKEASGFMSGKAGLRRELQIFRSLFKEGHIVVLNDLTNCLRHGDITIVDNYTPILFEVKKSKSLNQRGRKQAEKLEKLQYYLLTDEVTGLYDKDDLAIMRRRAMHAPEVEYSSQITDLIRQAFERGIAYAEVEEGLIYCVQAYDSPDKLHEVLQIFHRYPRQTSYPPIAVLLNQAKYVSNAYYPFTLSIRDPQALYSFYRGDYTIVILVDTRLILKKVTSRDMHLEPMNDPVIYRLRPQQPRNDLPDYIDIGHHFFNRIFFEFVSLDWLLEEIFIRWTRIIFDSDEAKDG